jgi:DNA-binding SARP family transcriptional activator
LEIRVLGELEVRRGGRLLTLPASKKTRALLGYLAATGRPHLREQLCGLLWDGPDDPRAALRWSLTKLRPLLDDAASEGGGPADDGGPGAEAGAGRRLCADRERVGFEARGALVDLTRLRALAQAGGPTGETAALDSLRAAAALLRGPLLEGLELPSSLRYHTWWRAERESARRLELTIRRALVERLARWPEEALGHARALLALDPLSEGSHLLVMKLLADLGRPREALAQYDECRRVLQSELQVSPSSEVERLRMALTARPSAPPAAGAAPRSVSQ